MIGAYIMPKVKKQDKQEGLEQILWGTADKLRKNMDAAEYKHIVLGLIFLKYISDSFAELYEKLKTGEGDYEGADPEDINEYRAENVFYVPPQARWGFLQGRAKLATVGKDVDDAMDAIEKDNPALKGVLPKEYNKEKLDKQSLGSLIDTIGTIALGDTESKAKDVLGRVYEYFLGQFALAEGKKGGQFYTPACIVRLLVNMLEPYEGRVFDPCCGSGGMFVQSEKFIAAHTDHYKGNHTEFGKLFDRVVSIYGQESNQTTWRLCKMNLAIRGIDSSNVKWNNEGSFLNDAHPDLKADFVIANPPFNDSDWSGELLKNDGRWQYGGVDNPPPTGNANYAWIQHFLYHLSPKGTAGFVLAKGSLSSKTNGEGEIRKALIEAGLVDCIVNMPTKLFLNTQIPACLWFLNKEKASDINHPRHSKILFIDARNMGSLLNRKTRELTEDDIKIVADTYHNWKAESEIYEDTAGFCKSATIEEVKVLDYVLTPGRYIGLVEDEDDFNFEERVQTLTAELEKQMQEGLELDKRIRANLKKVEVK